MKDFLIGMGIGFAVGACIVRSNKDVAKAVDKSKQMAEDVIEKSKDFVDENIVKPAKKSTTAKK